jgi:hypothetical protein
LSVSRENMKDQRLLRNLNAVLTKRIIRWLSDEANKDAKAYNDFYNSWGLCLKEGVAMDRFNAPAIAALLRYPSSVASDEDPCSLDQYVGRMKEGVDTIYYLVAQNRKVRTCTARALPRDSKSPSPSVQSVPTVFARCEWSRARERTRSSGCAGELWRRAMWQRGGMPLLLDVSAVCVPAHTPAIAC